MSAFVRSVPKDTPPPLPNAPRWYWWAFLVVVGAAVALLELFYSQAPVPPGVDPGDWIQRSYDWVGLPHPPFDATGSPYLYPPMIFPLLGALRLATGSPLLTGFIFGGALLVVLGLTSAHLARRYLAHGPVQLLFVGIAVLNGTMIQMLFWGGYPNYLAFAFLNEAMVFFLAFLRAPTRGSAAGFYVFASAIYLTHTLTFVVWGAAVLLAVFLLALRDRRWLGVWLSRPNLETIPILIATVVGYALFNRIFQIAQPGYLYSNPAAYYIDHVGEIFRPLTSGPVLFPAAPATLLSPVGAEALLSFLSILLLIVVAGFAIRRPGWVDLRVWIATGWFVATMMLPVFGYAGKIATDYSRFIYFMPFPGLLLLAIVLDRVYGRVRDRVSHPSLPTARSPLRRQRTSMRRTEAAAGAAVGLVLVLIAASVTIPTMATNEQINSGTSHDAMFLQAAHWLATNPTPGSILTLQGPVRWIEALTARGAFDIGPTWLLFEDWQILNAEKSYWAFNSRFAMTNNLGVVSYLGNTTPSRTLDPMYSTYYQGVQIPLMILPASAMSVMVETPSGTQNVSSAQWGPGTLSWGGPDPSLAATTFTTASFNYTETTTARSDGAIVTQIIVAPQSGLSVDSLTIGLLSPPAGPLLHGGQPLGVGNDSVGLLWNTSNVVGELPGRVNLTTRVALSPEPTQEFLSRSGAINSAVMTFTNSNPSAPLNVELVVNTLGASNPAIRLPVLMDTSAFLAEHRIRFVLIPTLPSYANTASFYQGSFGFRLAYQNIEWTILQQ